MSVFAFGLKYRGGGVPDLIAQHVAQAAGGPYDFMNTSTGLADKLKAVGEHLAASAKEMRRWYQLVFETGSNRWVSHAKWPPQEKVATKKLYIQAGGKLSFQPPLAEAAGRVGREF